MIIKELLCYVAKTALFALNQGVLSNSKCKIQNVLTQEMNIPSDCDDAT
jgi:hypothetical protein